MITKYQACVTISFILAILFSYQMSERWPRPAASRSFADDGTEVGSQQSAVSDRSGDRLNSDGTMHGVTLRRTRVYDAQGLQEPKSVLWKAQLFTLKPEDTYSGSISPIERGDLIRHDITYHGASSIITANKEAYFIKPPIDNDYWLFVIDLQTGEIKKRFKLQGGGFIGPVVAGDLLFVGEGQRGFSVRGGFYAFDHHDWKAKWEINRKGYDFFGISPVVADGMIYFGGAKIIHEPWGPYFANSGKIKGSVHAVDALTGTEKWMITVNGGLTPIAVADGAIYFGDGEHHLFAVNVKDGKEIWKIKASRNIKTPAIMDGRAFFSDDGGALYAVDLKNGQAIWKAATKNKVSTALAVYNKSIYYGGTENSLYAVDALTGQEKWAYQTTKPCRPPVAANGVIYVACLDNTILAIDAESGQERWKYKTPHRPISHPVVGNGVIYYLDEEGVMYALGSS
jgi:outer membrane protein assembly factor BamB